MIRVVCKSARSMLAGNVNFLIEINEGVGRREVEGR